MTDSNPLAVVTRTMGISTPIDALRIICAIDVLRSDEGSTVTFVCDNPDFNDQPNSKVICNGAWTGWKDREFAADSVWVAIRMAMAENTRLTK